jgi:prolyl 4-hydroxylase
MTDDLQRAAHSQELKAADDILNGNAPRDRSAAAADSSPFGNMCRQAVLSRGGDHIRRGDHHVSSGKTKAENIVAQLELPGEDRSLSVELLSDLPGPQISKIHGLVTREEIDHIIRKASPNFKAAVVFEGGSITTAKYRTSSTSWLKDDESDVVVSRVLERIKVVTGLSLVSSEELQVARYIDKDHGKYEPHYDWGTPQRVTRDFSISRNGESIGARIATLLIYLNDVDFGGETTFVNRNLTVAPEAGSAILFYNLDPSAAGDIELLHGACPVLRGEKLIMTKWIHELGNEALFDAAEGQKRLARDWKSLAEKLRGNEKHQEPLVLGKSCEERRAAGGCVAHALRMARVCPGSCEENLLNSEVRKRQIFEGVISPNVAQDILQLATSSAMTPGDGYDGRLRPLSMREVFSGTRLVAAARWAVSQPTAAGQAKAVRWVRALLTAVTQMSRAASIAAGSPNGLLLDGAHLACRSAVAALPAELASTDELFNMQDKSISAGSDIEVGTMTIAEARAKCLATPTCEGFTFKGAPTDDPVTIYMKSKQDLFGAGYGWTSYLRRREPEIPDSHPPHADNCHKQGRDCVAAPPQFYWRSHSATLFLHGPDSGDFTGGSFFYSPTWESPRADRLRVTPLPGRMLVFDAGDANIHGVEEVTNGTWCAISAWFTTDSERAMAARDLDIAEEILSATIA